MAAGDVVFFDDAIGWLGTEVFQLNTDALKAMFVVDELSVTAGLSGPAYGEGLTTDLSDSETDGGNAPTGGTDITNTWSATSGVGTLDASDIDIEQDGSNPTDARWMPVYSEEASNNEALFYLDLGGVIDMSAADFGVTWHGSGIATLQQA